MPAEKCAEILATLKPKFIHQPQSKKLIQESRFAAAKHVKTDMRVQPHAEEPIELDPQIRLVCPVGGVFQFSAAQLHSTVPNTSNVTRYSIGFRTVHLDDVFPLGGARDVDSACTRTTMGDYLRGTDFSHLPEEAIRMYRSKPGPDYAASTAAATGGSA